MTMIRQICCVPPSVVVKVACLFAVLLAPTADGEDVMYTHSHRRESGIKSADRHLRSHRQLRDPASQLAAGAAADITTPSSYIQLKRRDTSTACVECNEGSTRAADGTSQGNGQAATNNYERSDEKQGATESGGAADTKQDATLVEDEHDQWSYFEPTLQPTLEAADSPASHWFRPKEDDNKVPESVEEEVDCPWCHDDELDRRPDGTENGDSGFPDESFPDDPYDYPQADPDSYRDNNQGYGGGESSSYDQHRLIDDMVAPFFLLAAVLLILALVYTLLFLCVVRLGTIRIDEDRYPRGRVYFCGSLCFVPLCWFYRLYAADPSGGVGIASTSDARVMGLKREERKEAVAELLKQYSATVGEDGTDGALGDADADAEAEAEAEADVNTRLDDISPAETDNNSGPEVTETGPPSREDADDEAFADADENQCSICLDGYGK